MPIIRDKNGKILAFQAEDNDEPKTKVLTGEEAEEMYGSEINGVATNPPPQEYDPVTLQPVVTEKPKQKRRTRGEMAAVKVLENPKPGVEYIIGIDEGVATGSEFAATIPKMTDNKVENLEWVPSAEHKESNTEITALVKTSSVDIKTAAAIGSAMTAFINKAFIWGGVIDNLVVDSIDDKGAMKVAKDTRITLKNLRVDCKKLVEEKRLVLKNKMATDKAESDLWLHSFQLVEATFDKLEGKLKAKEDFALNAAKEAQAKLQAKRIAELKPYLQTESGADHYNLGAMAEEEYTKLLASYKRLADEKIEIDRKAEEKRKKEEEAEKAKILNRLGSLPGTTWDGQNAIYKNKVLISLHSLINMSDVSFAAIAETHQKAVAAESQEDVNAKIQRRYDRLDGMGLSYDEEKENFYFLTAGDTDLFSLKIVQECTDEGFDTLISEWNKQQAAKAKAEQEKKEADLKIEQQKIIDARYKLREQKLLELGLTCDGTLFSYGTEKFVSVATIKGDPDERFETSYGKMKALIEEKKAAKIEKSPDPEKIEKLLESLYKIVATLPIVESPTAKRMVAGTKIGIGKVTAWLEIEKEKL